MAVRIDTLVLGPLETNCYVIRCGEDCWVVDPAMAAPLVEFLRRERAEPGRILLTHGHGDHIAGAAGLKSAYPGARFLCPAADAMMLGDATANMSAMLGLSITAPAADELIRPGLTLYCGDSAWQVLDTSGHTPGGVSFYCADAAVVLTGDSLFAGSVGRTDIPDANEERLLKNIRENLLALPANTRVLPGHGGETTIGRQKRSNPFLARI